MKLGIDTSYLDLEVIVENISEEVKNLAIKHIEVIDYEVIPNTLKKQIEQQSRLNDLSNDEYSFKIPPFLKAILLNQENNHTTIITQECQERSDHTIEELTYIVNLDSENQPIGHSEIRNVFNRKNPPQVHDTNTHPTQRNKGLGTQRLKLINALSKALYNQPIHSDNSLQPKARKIWEKLEKDNLVKKYEVNGETKYQFLK